MSASASTAAALPSSSSDDARPPKVDVSGLSPLEYPQYTTWLTRIAKSPSGVEGLLDEQDALAWLRKECAVGRVDEVKMLSLFERYPLGLEPGHFFALLRITAWIQQGRSPARSLIFTQTTPPVTGLPAGTAFPLANTADTAAADTSRRSHELRKSIGSSKDLLSPSNNKVGGPSLRTPAAVTSQPQQPSVSAPSSKVPPPVLSAFASPSSSQLPLPLVPATSSTPAGTSNESVQRAVSSSMLPPPVPPEASKPSRSVGPVNPFKERHHRSTSLAAPGITDPLAGFDPAPILVKPVKPKVVRPTPIVATAGQPNPVTSAADHSVHGAPTHVGGASGLSARSVKSIDDGTSPALPPRPADTEKPPPPLPPRAHISPLIQAGLQASKQVRQQKGALPPKTFTVLQSSTSRSKPEARLLTGESAPPNVVAELPPPPTHHAKRKVSLHETKRSVSEATSGLIGLRRAGSDDGNEGPQRAASHTATVIAAPKPSRPSHSRHHLKGRGSESASGGDGSLHQASVAAPKAQYADGSGFSRTKPPTLPSWLREQEELQRSALAEGKPLSPPPEHGRHSQHASEEQQRKDFILNFERSRHEPTVLDEEFDVFPTELSEQASRAASIDRPHNPFLHRSSQAEAEKLRLQPLLRQHQHHLERERLKEKERQREAERDGEHGGSARSRSPELNRPLGRSKTLHGKGPPPPPPSHGANSRKRLESFPATFNSGTYAGFGRTSQGGLRLMPPSAKADVGLRAGEETRRPALHRGSSALSVSDRSSGAAAASHRGDEDSGETSLNSTNPTSVQELAQSVERRVSNSSNTKSRAGPNGGSFSLKEKVSDFLKLQDGPPNGSRPIDELKRDAIRLAERKGWINRRGEENLLREDPDEDEGRAGESQGSIRLHQSKGSNGPWREDDEDEDEVERWDDAPMPDDTYRADHDGGNAAPSTAVTDTSDTPTPTPGEGSPERAKATPPPPPRRSASTGMPPSTTAPIARRPSGYVARRASQMEQRVSSSASPGLSRSGSGSAPGATHGISLARAASFSVRSAGGRRNTSDQGHSGISSDHDAAAGDGKVNKRASWFEGSAGSGGGIDQRWKQRFLQQHEEPEGDEPEGDGEGDGGWKRLD